MYIYQHPEWPNFKWDHKTLTSVLGKVRHLQGKLTGKMESLGFELRAEASLKTLTFDVLKTSEIEGEILNPDQVRSSLARHLGMEIAGLVESDNKVDGVVEMMLDATQNFQNKLTLKRLTEWNSLLFPTGKSGVHKIRVGQFRNDANGPMQVVSGAIGKEKVHFQAPDAADLKKEMNLFLKWFNSTNGIDPVLKAAIAHLWFVTLHPFDDGNGRIARAIADLQLARADENNQRFYSMSSRIRTERKEYYSILEQTQKSDLDITDWLNWFLNCLTGALSETDKTLIKVLDKAHFWKMNSHLAFNDRQRLMINKLLDGFDGKLTSSKWAKITKCSPDSALRDIQDLTAMEILKKESAGGRSTHYLMNYNSGI